MGLVSAEYAGGRVHFPGLIEHFGGVWGLLPRNSDLRSDGETTNKSHKPEDVCWRTLSGI